MSLKLFIEMDSTGVIGNSKDKNGRPWKAVRETVLFFEKETLLAKNVFMSEHTFDLLHSLTRGELLPDRTITIFSRTLERSPSKRVRICRSPQEAKEMFPGEDIIVIGDKTTIDAFLADVDEIIIAKIRGKHIGDSHIGISFLKGFTEKKEKQYIISKAKPHITAQYYERK